MTDTPNAHNDAPEDEMTTPNEGKGLSPGRREPFEDHHLAATHLAREWEALLEGLGEDGAEGIVVASEMRKCRVLDPLTICLDWLLDAVGRGR